MDAVLRVSAGASFSLRVATPPLAVRPRTPSTAATRRHPAFGSPCRRQRLVISASDVEDATPSDAEVLSFSDPRFAGQKVLVAGATGGVGAAVVRLLASRGVPVKALVRNTAK
jgi:hypothetical protein